MSKVKPQPIVVGVSADGESEGAVRFAVDEALRQGCGITIVHAMSESLPPPPDTLIGFGSQSERTHHFVDRTVSAEAYRLVTDTASRARAMSQGRVAVNTRIPVGRSVHAIVNASEDARLIVLQHRDLGMFERIFVRSTSAGVSARAHCPVVTVPPIWDPDLHRNRVTVGIDSLEESSDVLRTAFETASARRARLDVVHSRNFVGADADIVLSTTLSAEWQARSERELEKLLAPWMEQYPQVKVERRVFDQGAIDVLIKHSQESDLLVLGRFRATLLLPLPLGPITRAMVNGAHCPVEIVPHTGHDRAWADKDTSDNETERRNPEND